MANLWKTSAVETAIVAATFTAPAVYAAPARNVMLVHGALADGSGWKGVVAAALTGRLGHQIGHYNAVQRLLYTGVIVALCVVVVTGLSIWKPVQLGWLTGLFGGYPVARGIHLAAMGCIAAFVVVHLLLVAIYPRTLIAMLATVPAEPGAAP